LSNTEIKKRETNSQYCKNKFTFKSPRLTGKSFLNYLRVATSPAGINFPVFTNLEPITPDNTIDVTAKRKDGSFLIKPVHKSGCKF